MILLVSSGIRLPAVHVSATMETHHSVLCPLALGYGQLDPSERWEGELQALGWKDPARRPCVQRRLGERVQER